MPSGTKSRDVVMTNLLLAPSRGAIVPGSAGGMHGWELVLGTIVQGRFGGWELSNFFV